jgi:hypothetical protein
MNGVRCADCQEWMRECDQVLAEPRHHLIGRHPTSAISNPGEKFSVKLVNIFDFNGDKISRETIFLDVATQLKQLKFL